MLNRSLGLPFRWPRKLRGLRKLGLSLLAAMLGGWCARGADPAPGGCPTFDELRSLSFLDSGATAGRLKIIDQRLASDASPNGLVGFKDMSDPLAVQDLIATLCEPGNKVSFWVGWYTRDGTKVWGLSTASTAAGLSKQISANLKSAPFWDKLLVPPAGSDVSYNKHTAPWIEISSTNGGWKPALKKRAEEVGDPVLGRKVDDWVERNRRYAQIAAQIGALTGTAEAAGKGYPFTGRGMTLFSYAEALGHAMQQVRDVEQLLSSLVGKTAEELARATDIFTSSSDYLDSVARASVQALLPTRRSFTGTYGSISAAGVEKGLGISFPPGQDPFSPKAHLTVTEDGGVLALEGDALMLSGETEDGGQAGGPGNGSAPSTFRIKLQPPPWESPGFIPSLLAEDGFRAVQDVWKASLMTLNASVSLKWLEEPPGYMIGDPYDIVEFMEPISATFGPADRPAEWDTLQEIAPTMPPGQPLVFHPDLLDGLGADPRTPSSRPDFLQHNFLSFVCGKATDAYGVSTGFVYRADGRHLLLVYMTTGRNFHGSFEKGDVSASVVGESIGEVLAAFELDPATTRDRREPPAIVVGGPSEVTVFLGQALDLQATVVGKYTNLTWRRGLVPVATNSLLFHRANASLADSGDYVVTASNEDGLGVSKPVRVRVLPAPVPASYEEYRRSNLGNGVDTRMAQGDSDPDGDGFPNFLEMVMGGNPLDPATPALSLTSAGVFSLVEYLRPRTPPGGVIPVLQSAPTRDGPWTRVTNVADVFPRGDTQESVSLVLPRVPENAYLRFGASSGPEYAVSRAVPVESHPPVIEASPADQVVVAGKAVRLAVLASGAGPLLYQWRKDGVTLPGQTNSVLERQASRAEDSGLYQVRVSNAAGMVLSSPGRLEVKTSQTVSGRPSILKQSERVVAVLGRGVALWVQATGAEPLTYSWDRGGQDLPAAGNGPMLVLPKAQSTDAGTYRVTVKNGSGSVVSAPITLVLEAGILSVAPSETGDHPMGRIPLLLDLSGAASFMLESSPGLSGEPWSPVQGLDGNDGLSLSIQPVNADAKTRFFRLRRN